MRVLVNYANDNVKFGQKLNSVTGKHIAHFDKIFSYSPQDISNDFKLKNAEILNVNSKNGLFLWKPYIVKKTLDKLNEGDILFYCDSGAFFLKKMDQVFKLMKKIDIWCCGLPLIEKQFTKTETFYYLNCLNDKFTDTNQIHASFFAIKKSKVTVKFVNEWLFLCENIKILNAKNYDVVQDENINFVGHRYDQSIFSLLCKKYNIEPMMDPSQFGRFPSMYYLASNYLYVPKNLNGNYGILIVHHRMHKFGVKGLLKSIAYCVLPHSISRCIYKKIVLKKTPWINKELIK